MPLNAGAIYATISLDTKQWDMAIKRIVDRQLPRLNKQAGLGLWQFRKMGIDMTVTGGLITYALARVANAFTDASAAAEVYATRIKFAAKSQADASKIFERASELAYRIPGEYEEVMEVASRFAVVMKGNTEEIQQFLEMTADLAGATGVAFSEMGDQIIRATEGGIQRARRLRELGIAGLMGFRGGIHYTAEYTKKQMLKMWQDADVGLKGAAMRMAKTWQGLMSMYEDNWFRFRRLLMEEGGLFEMIKKPLVAFNEALFDNWNNIVQFVKQNREAIREGGKLASKIFLLSAAMLGLGLAVNLTVASIEAFLVLTATMLLPLAVVGGGIWALSAMWRNSTQLAQDTFIEMVNAVKGAAVWLAQQMAKSFNYIKGNIVSWGDAIMATLVDVSNAFGRWSLRTGGFLTAIGNSTVEHKNLIVASMESIVTYLDYVGPRLRHEAEGMLLFTAKMAAATKEMTNPRTYLDIATWGMEAWEEQFNENWFGANMEKRWRAEGDKIQAEMDKWLTHNIDNVEEKSKELAEAWAEFAAGGPILNRIYNSISAANKAIESGLFSTPWFKEGGESPLRKRAIDWLKRNIVEPWNLSIGILKSQTLPTLHEVRETMNRDVREWIKMLREKFPEFAKLWDDYQALLDKINKGLDEFNPKKGETGLSFGAVFGGFDFNKFSTDVADFWMKFTDWGTIAADTVKEAITSLRDAMGDAFASMILESKSTKEAMQDFAKAILESWLRMLANLIAQLMIAAAVAAFLGIFTGGATTAATGASKLVTGGPQEGMFKRLTRGSFARGTDYVPRTGMYMLHKGESVSPDRTARTAEAVPIPVLTPEVMASLMTDRKVRDAVVGVVAGDFFANGTTRRMVGGRYG